MSLQQAAQHLAAQGRGNDTTLVHMTPNEVQGLQQIAMAAGGSLSINPSTGLPEAGFLDDMMPMIIGGGLAIATGGTSLALTPAMLGLGVGGIQALRTGNLMEGVKAGLGAYGGAGLAGGLMGAGVQNIASSTPMAEQLAAASGDATAGVATQNQLAQASNFDKLGAGVKGLGTSEGWSNLAANTPGGAMGLAKTGLYAATPAIASALEPKAPPPTTPDANMGQRYSYSAGPTTPFPQPDVSRAGSPEQFQSFGKEQRFFTPSYTKINADQAKSLYGYAEGGGVSNLGDYSDGGRLLRGPGDGVSDSIPAMIGKKQPARLADGEFVVPARIVSELGNGSTEAGARKLYAMMARIQSARGKTVGKNKVAKNSRAERFLPA
jgi:hypothetical protein